MGLIEQAERLDHPFYYYDLDALGEHLKRLKRDSEGVLKIWYACKANPLSFVLRELAAEGFGFDVASEGEFNHVLRSGGKAENILLTGPAKSRPLLRRLLEKGLRVVVCESVNQVQWLNEVASELAIKPQVLLRVQLDWDSNEDSVLGGNEVTPFGQTPTEWKQIAEVDTSALDILGFHIFQWGNLLCTQKLAHIWQTSAQVCSELAEDLNIQMRVLDLGGGIGIPYTKDETAFDFSAAVDLLAGLKSEYALDELWMEFGRYAVGEFGSFLTRVVDVKCVRGQKLLVLESGINQLARPALINQAFPCENLSRPASETSQFKVCGPLCTSLDHLGDYELPSETAVGDWLLFSQCGAYGFTESMPFFLGHSLPGEVVRKDAQYTVAREPLPASTYLKLF